MVTLLAEISKEIYAAATEGIPITYLLWNPTSGVVDEDYDPLRVALLNTASQSLIRLHQQPMQWYNCAFDSKGDVVADMIVVAD